MFYALAASLDGPGRAPGLSGRNQGYDRQTRCELVRDRTVLSFMNLRPRGISVLTEFAKNRDLGATVDAKSNDASSLKGIIASKLNYDAVYLRGKG